jgi:protease-4
MHDCPPALPPRRRDLALPLALPLALAFAVAAAAFAPGQAAAQAQNMGGTPRAGLPLPVTGVAAAEEPTATTVNPAGIGFVHAQGIQYFHVEGEGGDGDGLYYAAGLLGPIGPAFSVEWIRPGAGPRYRLTTLGLALTDGRVLSLGLAWRWWNSPDATIEPMHAWDVGLTLRPWRHFSVAASALGLDLKYAGVRQPVQYDVGLALRFLDDSLTLSADLLANDKAARAFDVTGGAVGLALELGDGLALSAQYRFPLANGGAFPVQADRAGVVSLAWNAPHGGVSAGAAMAHDDTRWLAGVRLSGERYPSASRSASAPRLDLAAELEPRHFLFFEASGTDPFGDLVRRLEEAGEDSSVGAVVLELGDLPIGGGKIEELRATVLRLRQRKPVLAYLTGGSLRSYWLASAASSIAMAPPSTLVVNGLASSQYYLKDGLARLGVAVEVARAGGYKTAPEPLTRTGPSPESREMTGALLDDVFERLVTDVAAGRKLEVATVRALVDRGVFSAAESRQERLVDELLWPDEVEGWVKRASGTSLDVDEGYDPALRRQARRWGRPAVIAVIGLEGAISAGRSRREPLGVGPLTGAGSVIEQLEAAAAASDVKAIVLRIDSPGGDAVASDLIWRAVKKAREKKPVIASMGDLAASGGYLVAVGAERIIAQPSTLTGSIGVFVLKPELSGLLEKLSIHRDVQARGKNADLASMARPWTPEERALVEKQVDVVYGNFLDRVVEGRSLPRAEVERVAGGRVWTGQQALAHKLVDQLGGLDDAVAWARQRAGIRPGDLVEVRRVGGGWSDFRLSAGMKALAGDEPLLRRTAALFPELRTAALLLELGPVLALPLDWIEPGSR